jgi:hypothetical protein
MEIKLIVEGVEIKNDDSTTLCLEPNLEFILWLEELMNE